jgi:uncharacterized lipoprotein YmbA
MIRRLPSGPCSSFAALGIMVAGLSLFASCSIPLPSAQADLTRYYLLTSAARPEAKAETVSKRWVIGVRNVAIPSYLRTKSFAIRSHTNEVNFLDLARWGEPLEQGVERVLVENLQALPNVARISMQPFRAEEQRDFDLLVQVSACEGTARCSSRPPGGSWPWRRPRIPWPKAATRPRDCTGTDMTAASWPRS